MEEGRIPEDYEGKEELEAVAPEHMSPPHLHKQRNSFTVWEKGHSVCMKQFKKIKEEKIGLHNKSFPESRICFTVTIFLIITYIVCECDAPECGWQQFP